MSRVPAHSFLQSWCSSSATASYRILVRHFCRTKSSLCFEGEGGRPGPEQNKTNNKIKYITKRRGHFIPVFIFPGKWPRSLCSSPLLKLSVSHIRADCFRGVWQERHTAGYSFFSGSKINSGLVRRTYRSFLEQHYYWELAHSSSDLPPPLIPLY